jgi:DhnA family fructose-bisphosphate aldolase class Ia
LGVRDGVYDETRGDEGEKTVIFVRLGHEEGCVQAVLYLLGQAKEWGAPLIFCCFVDGQDGKQKDRCTFIC